MQTIRVTPDNGDDNDSKRKGVNDKGGFFKKGHRQLHFCSTLSRFYDARLNYRSQWRTYNLSGINSIEK